MSTDRKGHYIKPATKCTIPGVVFAVICHPHTDSEQLGRALLEQTWGTASVAVSYRRRGKWTGIQSARVSTTDALRLWMEERARPGRVNWVITPDVGDSLTLSQWWQHAEATGVHFRDAVRGGTDAACPSENGTRVRIGAIALSQRCGILEYTQCGVCWRWVSARNYWPDDSGSREDSAGIGRRASRGGVGTSDTEQSPASSHACALLARFRALCDWWERIATAPFGRTAGQLAWGIMRSRLPARTLCTHGHDAAHRLERRASHGGRASIFCVADVGFGIGGDSAPNDRTGREPYPALAGPITQVDVQSMYPALLRDEAYPVKLVSYYKPTPAALADLVRGGVGVIADVHIWTDVPNYPLRQESRTIYPTGNFRAQLAGPELLELLRHGTIKRVYSAAVYDVARPFVKSMDAILQDRTDAIQRGDKEGASFAKLCANSLAGRFAKREGGWERRARLDMPGEWGERTIHSTRTARARRLRYLCGCAFEWVEEQLPRGPHTAIFAYLTAYGRVRLASILAACPPKTVVSADTDGAWVLDSALIALTDAGILAAAGAGRLRIKGSGHSARFLTPRHYHIDGRWTLAGYSEHEVSANGRDARHVAAVPLIGHRAHCAPDRLFKRISYSPLPVDAGGGIIGDDGWVRAPHIEQQWRDEE